MWFGPCITWLMYRCLDKGGDSIHSKYYRNLPIFLVLAPDDLFDNHLSSLSVYLSNAQHSMKEENRHEKIPKFQGRMLINNGARDVENYTPNNYTENVLSLLSCLQGHKSNLLSTWT